MVQIDLRSLVGKLNDTVRDTLESAAGLCLSRTHYDVEIEHWLVKLLEKSDTELHAILNHYDVELARLSADLTRSLDSFKTGNSRPPALSPRIVDIAREAWVLASLEYNAQKTSSGHLLCALLSDDSLIRLARDISKEFDKISAEGLRKDLPSIVANSSEAQQAYSASSTAEPGAPLPTGSGKTPALDQYTVDLTAKAKQGGVDPVLGRDAEIRQIVDILSRRRQNNPIMTGEAGVGKTAVVEGFALRIATGDIPDILKGVCVRTLDLGLLQAGAGMKGEFENRLRSVIDEVKSSTTPIILFIDEAHTMIGAGGQAGQNDAANLLKPALARGELRTIAATTWAEYKKYFEKDPALTRRFQVVKVEEPSEQSAIEMMRGLAGALESHHKTRVLDEAVIESVRLSHRYIPDRHLPDKCVSVLDTACAKVAISQSSTPAAVEDAQRRIEQLDVAADILQREMMTGHLHEDSLAANRSEKEEVTSQLETLNAQWLSEQELSNQVHNLSQQLIDLHGDDSQGEDGAEEKLAVLKEQLKVLDEQLKQVQGEAPLTHVCVDAQAVAEVIANWTGIPLGRMVSDEIASVLNLREQLERRVIGQSHVLESLAKSVRTSRAKLTDPNKPIAVYLMVGTSGVGKTETALAVADLLYGGEQNMTTINMSEFKEEHKVSLLMGAPPGYVGYGEGGVLTEAVRRKPYSVVLLDEMEKAHHGVQDVFYQVFDKGQMKDGEGRDINFKNTIVIMTSNAGTDTITKLCADPELMPDEEGLLEALKPDLLEYFKPAFLGRVTVVPFFPLRDEALTKIIRLKLSKIAKRVKDNYNAEFNCTDKFVETVAARCQDVDTGARNIDHILEGNLLPKLSAEFLSKISQGEALQQVVVDADDEGSMLINVT